MNNIPCSPSYKITYPYQLALRQIEQPDLPVATRRHHLAPHGTALSDSATIRHQPRVAAYHQNASSKLSPSKLKIRMLPSVHTAPKRVGKLKRGDMAGVTRLPARPRRVLRRLALLAPSFPLPAAAPREMLPTLLMLPKLFLVISIVWALRCSTAAVSPGSTL
ncbi:hypothetical protein Vretimale_12913 [Volvox reticuliferus]|nr:hypothetical protein Vretimale_12913 [Volvox reticuliferus]